MSLYGAYLRFIDNPLHNRSETFDFVLDEQIKAFRNLFDDSDAYDGALFSNPNKGSTAESLYNRINRFVENVLNNKDIVLTVELCIVMETHIKRSLKYKLIGYVAITVKAYIALFKGAMLASAGEKDALKLYYKDRAKGPLEDEYLSAEMVATSVKHQRQHEQNQQQQEGGGGEGEGEEDNEDLPPEEYQVVKEMIIRSSCFYSFETLINSYDLPVVEIAHTALHDFIELQEQEAERVDFTPLFPAVLSLCRRGFSDDEGIFARIPNINSRRGVTSGAMRLQSSGTKELFSKLISLLSPSSESLPASADDTQEAADYALVSTIDNSTDTRLRAIGFTILLQCVETMFTKVQTVTALKKRLEPHLAEIARTIFVCLLRHDQYKLLSEKSAAASGLQKNGEEGEKGSVGSHLDSNYGEDGHNDDGCSDESNSVAFNHLDDAVAPPATNVVTKQRRKGSVVIDGKVVHLFDEIKVDEASVDAPPPAPIKPVKPPKSPKPNTVVPPKPPKPARLLKKGSEEEEEEMDPMVDPLNMKHLDQDIADERSDQAHNDMLQTPPLAWQCLRFLACIPSIPAVCTLIQRFIATFDDICWEHDELIVRILSELIRASSTIPSEVSVTASQENLVHVRNAPVEHLLLTHAQRLVSDYTTLTPMHIYYDGYSPLYHADGSDTAIVPVSQGSENRARRHVDRLEALDKVLKIATALLEKSLAEPEEGEVEGGKDLSAEEDAKSPLVEKILSASHGQMSPRLDHSFKQAGRKRDLSEFFAADLQSMLDVLWHGSMWFPRDHLTSTETELPGDHHAFEMISKLDSEARRRTDAHIVNTGPVHNERLLELITNALGRAYAAIALLIKTFHPKNPKEIQSALPQILFYATRRSVCHSMFEHDESSLRYKQLTPHLLRFRTVIAHAVNIVVAESRDKFGGCTLDTGYWASIARLGDMTEPATPGSGDDKKIRAMVKHDPFLFSDSSFAHLMVCMRSPDWHVVRQVSVAILNLLEERLHHGISPFVDHHYHGTDATDTDRSQALHSVVKYVPETHVLQYAPLTHTQLGMIHDVTFQMLCAFCSAQPLIISVMWCVHRSLIRVFGINEILESIPFILALEEYWTKFSKSVKAYKPAFRARCLEMLSCQRLYFLSFWLTTAKELNNSPLRKYCLSLMSTWASVGKLPKTLSLNVYDLEFSIEEVESVQLSKLEMESLSIGSKVDNSKILEMLLESADSEEERKAMQDSFTTSYYPEEPMEKAARAESESTGTLMESEDEEDERKAPVLTLPEEKQQILKHGGRSKSPKKRMSILSPSQAAAVSGVTNEVKRRVSTLVSNILGNEQQDCNYSSVGDGDDDGEAEKDPRVSKLEGAGGHMAQALAILEELERETASKLASVTDNIERHHLETELLRVQGQITGGRYMQEALDHMTNGSKNLDYATSSPTTTAHKKKAWDIAKENASKDIESAKKGVRKRIRSISIAGSKLKDALNKKMSPRKSSNAMDIDDELDTGLGIAAAGIGGKYSDSLTISSPSNSSMMPRRSTKMRVDAEDTDDDDCDNAALTHYSVDNEALQHHNVKRDGSDLSVLSGLGSQSPTRSTKMRGWESDDEEDVDNSPAAVSAATKKLKKQAADMMELLPEREVWEFKKEKQSQQSSPSLTSSSAPPSKEVVDMMTLLPAREVWEHKKDKEKSMIKAPAVAPAPAPTIVEATTKEIKDMMTLLPAREVWEHKKEKEEAPSNGSKELAKLAELLPAEELWEHKSKRVAR
jgi:hypothetical protein